MDQQVSWTLPLRQAEDHCKEWLLVASSTPTWLPLPPPNTQRKRVLDHFPIIIPPTSNFFKNSFIFWVHSKIEQKV